MALSINNRNFPIETVNGIRCRIVETNAGNDRMEFLKNLLEFNKYEVLAEETTSEAGEKNYKLGVTDFRFHPVIAIYANKLKTQDGKFVSPRYWNQEPEIQNAKYWEYREKTLLSDDDLKIVPGVFYSV